MIIWSCVNDWWVLNMMFIIVRCIFSFTWIVWLYVLLSCDNGPDYVLMLIMAMFVKNHDDSCWIIMVTKLVNYIYIYICVCVCVCVYARARIYVVDEFSYMLLATIWWCKHVLKYVGVDLVTIVWTYALLLMSHMFMYSWLMVTDFISILATTNT